MADNFEFEIDIDADGERVWRALTEPRELEAWFCEHADVSLHEKRYDFWGRFTHGTPTRDDGRHQVLDIDPGRRLVFAFPYDGAETTVEFALEGDARLRVRHLEVPSPGPGSQTLSRHLWSAALWQLRAYIERGDAGPRFDYTWPTRGAFAIHADLNAPREAVFEELRHGWTDPEYLRPARNADEDFAWDVGVLVGIKVLDVVPSERYELAWIQDTATTLTYTLADAHGGTRVTLVHSGFGGDTDEQGMAEGFFSGLVEWFWRIETGGTWPPPTTKLDSPYRQSGWRFGVRTRQSASAS